VQKKRFLIAGLFFVTQILSFSIDGLKSTLFMAVVALVIMWMPQFSLVGLKKLVLAGFCGISIVSVIQYIQTGNYNISDMIIRRIMFIPNLLSSYYFDFFMTHAPDYFRSSFMRQLGFVSPYEDKIGRIIGAYYLNSPTTNCNNGLVADAITNMGLIGILVMPLILILTFRILDKRVAGLDHRIYIASALYLSSVFLNTFYFTILLTHGLIILGIILGLLDRGEVLQKKNTRI